MPDGQPFRSQVRAYLRRVNPGLADLSPVPATQYFAAVAAVHAENAARAPAPPPAEPPPAETPEDAAEDLGPPPEHVRESLPLVLAPPPKLADLPKVLVYIPPLARTAKAVICAGCGFVGTEHNVFFRYGLGLCPPCRRKAKYYVRKQFGRLSGAALLRELHIPKPQPKPKGVDHA